MLKKITLSRTANIVANIVLIAGSCFMVGQEVRREYISSHPDKAWHAGQIFDLVSMTVPGVECGRKTLVLAVSSTCHFCQRDVPVYQKIPATPKVQDGSIQLAYILPDSKDEAKKWMNSNHLEGHWLAHANVFKNAGFRATPTILLLDETNKVVKSWEGVLRPAQEKELMAVLQ